MKEYKVFISHSWSYSNFYDQLTNMLTKASNFSYKDYSVPKDNPLVVNNIKNYESELRNKIKNKMSLCSVVIIMTGVYASYSHFIQMEIEIANELGKPIVAVEPWGSKKTSVVVKEAADKIIGWNTPAIVNAIKEVCS